MIVYIKSSHTVRVDYPDVLTFMDKMLILIVCNSLAHYVYTRFNTCSVFANAELNVIIFFELLGKILPKHVAKKSKICH